MVIIKDFIKESNKIEGVYEESAVDQSYKAWSYIIDERSLTHESIKQTHELIIMNRQPDIAGEYRNIAVRIADEIRDNQAEIEAQIDELLEWNPQNAIEALLWHIRFEKIHPFEDGNGRVGRMIYLWHCNKLNEEPILWRAEDRKGYYSLFNTDESLIKHKIDTITTNTQ
jgi:Fic family protein